MLQFHARLVILAVPMTLFSLLITNINIDLSCWKSQSGPRALNAPRAPRTKRERSSLWRRRTGEYQTQRRDSGRFNERYRIPAPFCPLFIISGAPALILRPASAARKEHKQLAETSRVDYVSNHSNQTAVVKRMPVRREGRVSGPDSLNKMTEFIKHLLLKNMVPAV